MDVLNWFVQLDHQTILICTYIAIALLTVVNAFTKNINIVLLFLPIIIFRGIYTATAFNLIDWLELTQDKSIWWLQFIYFSFFEILIILSLIIRKQLLAKAGYEFQYRFYIQELGLGFIAILSIILQLISIGNWIVYYLGFDYSLVWHGLYSTLKTILLGLNNFVLISLTIQNVFGLLYPSQKRILKA